MLSTLTFAAGVLLPLTAASSWPGWSGVKHLITFGDSYSQTGFEVSGTQPNPSNPLGNPKYPGFTSSNGPNWIDFLTTTFNATYIETINFAYGGATVNAKFVKPFIPEVLSLNQQIKEEYLPHYAGQNRAFKWRAEDTLFAFWFGINDIGGYCAWENKTEVANLIFADYTGLVETIFQTGARNFLLLNVPPIDRSPQLLSHGGCSIAAEKSAIADWNARVTKMAHDLTSKHPEATTFIFDTNTLFNRVIDDPKSYPETSAYKNTTGFCPAYENGTKNDWYAFDSSCEYPVDEYLWLNQLHPTFRVHNATAHEIVKQLS